MMTPTNKRNLHADLAICDAATPGLWEADLNSDDSAQILSTSAPGWVCQTWYKNEEVMPNSANNARFIAAAREGWPEAIRRAIAAEAEVERLCAFIESESECAIEAAQDRETLVRILSDIIYAIDRGDLYKTKMSNGLDDVIHRAREALCQ